MRKNWKVEELGNICEFKYGAGLPKRKRGKGEFPVYGSGGIIDYHKDFYVKGAGIIVGRKGTIGSVYFEKRNFFPIDTVFYIEPRDKAYDIKFLYFLLSMLHLDKLNTDAAVPGLNRNVAYKQKVLIPPIKIQKQIASILSAYDDLIENNNRRIKILEEMAQTIYNEWFVKFRFPGHSKVKMVNSELGKIPEGWNVTALKEILALRHGYAFKSKEFGDEKSNIILVRMGNFKETGGLQFEDNTKYLISEKYNNKFLLEPDDLVMVLSDVTRNGRIIGKVGLIPKDENTYLLNQRVAKIEVENKYKPFLCIYFNSVNFRNYCLSRANSVTVLNLSNDHIYKHRIVLPPDSVIEKFNSIIIPLISRGEITKKQNIILKETRDLLLPKLISGEVDVADLDIDTEDIK